MPSHRRRNGNSFLAADYFLDAGCFFHSAIFFSTEMPESLMSCFIAPRSSQPSRFEARFYMRASDCFPVVQPLKRAPWNRMRFFIVKYAPEPL